MKQKNRSIPTTPGHSREVNESNYCGRPEIDTQLVSKFINDKMAIPESLDFGIKEAI